MGDEYQGKIILSYFSYLTAPEGGAIHIINLQINCSIESCYFDSCTTTGKRTSSSRDSTPSGGACYFDIKSINITNVLIKKCKAFSFGHSIYCSISFSFPCAVNCLSDEFSGQKISSKESSVFVFDRGDSFIKDINISYPTSITYPGAIHIGMYIDKSDNKYWNIIFNSKETEENQLMSISFAIKEGETNKCDYFHIENSFSNDGLFTFWYGKHYFNHFYIIQSAGPFFRKSTHSTFPFEFVRLSNSYICQNVQINDITLDESCLTNSLNEEKIMNSCKFYDLPQMLSLKQTCKYNSFHFKNIIFQSIIFISF